MRGERFKLARVLRVRRIEEELARDRFKAVEQVARQAEETAETIGREIAKAQEELTETRLHRRIPPEDLVMAQMTLESLDRTLTEQRRRAGDLRREADGMRAAWERARGDMRTLERLEERFRASQRAEEQAQENREMDENALRRAPSGSPLPNRALQSSPGVLPADEGTKDSPEAS
jgi:flagellar export protein FliJ